MSQRFSRRAFALPDLLMLAVVLIGLAALLCVGAGRSRTLSSLGESSANLRQFGAGLASYGSDNADAVYAFSWRGGVVNPTTYPDLRGPFVDDLSSAAAQAVDILRRRAGREDITVPSGWIPHVRFSHLVLADAMGLSLPLRFAVSPEDKYQLLWASNPRAFDQGQFPPQPDPTPANKRWPYASTYEMGPAFYSPDYASGADGTVSQATTHSTYQIAGGAVLGRRRTSQIALPSQKAFVWDTAQRHMGGRTAYFMYPEARVPICFADGAVRVRSTRSANPGFNPSSPQSQSPTTLTYAPVAWEPPVPPGAGANVQGMYRWTRNGLGGRDFDGDEVPAPR